MNKLSELLQKLGLQHEDLTPEEKATYRVMEETMREEMTIDAVVKFLKAELERFQAEFASNETSMERDFILKAQTRCYTALLYYIESPKLAKEKLETYLENIKINR